MNRRRSLFCWPALIPSTIRTFRENTADNLSINTGRLSQLSNAANLGSRLQSCWRLLLANIGYKLRVLFCVSRTINQWWNGTRISQTNLKKIRLSSMVCCACQQLDCLMKLITIFTSALSTRRISKWRLEGRRNKISEKHKILILRVRR